MPNPDRMANVTTSPRLAAIGVAILSGFTLKRLATIIIPMTIDPKIKLAKLAVHTLLLTRIRISSPLTLSFTIKLVIQATNEARKPTTID